MPDWNIVKNWLYNWDEIQTCLTSIDYLMRSGSIIKNVVDMVDEILKTIDQTKLSKEEALVYDYLTQAVLYFRELPPVIERQKPKSRRGNRYANIVSPTRRLIKSPPRELPPNYRPMSIEQLNKEKHVTKPMIINAKLHNDYETRRIKSVERK